MASREALELAERTAPDEINALYVTRLVEGALFTDGKGRIVAIKAKELQCGPAGFDPDLARRLADPKFSGQFKMAVVGSYDDARELPSQRRLKDAVDALYGFRPFAAAVRAAGSAAYDARVLLARLECAIVGHTLRSTDNYCQNGCGHFGGLIMAAATQGKVTACCRAQNFTTDLNASAHFCGRCHKRCELTA